jgi:6-hydroxymethylpterin diphosphokinase MptE-like
MQEKLQTTLINWKALGVDPKIIVENSERVRGRFIPTPDITDEPCAVVAYGPSLANVWQEIGNFSTIFTCSGSHKFLIERGIVPTFHCESDPRGHKIAMLGVPHRSVEYLIASVCHSNYFDKLEAAGAKIKLWHVLFDENEIYELIPKGDWVICGGTTIGPRAIKLARLSGFVNLHLFGFDGSGRHAGAHTNAPPDSVYNPIVVRGQTYQISENLLYQTRVLFDELDRCPEIKATFYGEGMIQTMARHRTPKVLPRSPMAVQK